MRKSSLSNNLTENWNSLVNHPLQSYEWGLFREKTGVKVVRFDETPHPYQLTIHKLPYLPYRIGYLPKGPPITQTMINTLYNYGKAHNIIFFQLEPDVVEKLSDHTPQFPFIKPSHHPLFTKHTFMIDLSKTEDQLLASMHPKTRYNLKVAQKHKVVIKNDNSKEAFTEYLRLVEETTKRQGFYAHSLSYHKKMWETLSPSIARLWTASYQGTIVAAWIIFLWKETMYYPYGTSSREFRNIMAPNLLLWEIIKWGKKHKYNYFDLWGALGPNPDQNDPFYGFHRFKAGFSPELVTFIGSFDLVVNPLLYKLYCIADTIRWKLLKK